MSVNCSTTKSWYRQQIINIRPVTAAVKALVHHSCHYSWTTTNLSHKRCHHLGIRVWQRDRADMKSKMYYIYYGQNSIDTHDSTSIRLITCHHIDLNVMILFKHHNVRLTVKWLRTKSLGWLSMNMIMNWTGQLNLIEDGTSWELSWIVTISTKSIQLIVDYMIVSSKWLPMACSFLKMMI